MFLLPDFFLYFMAFFTPYIKNNHYLCTRKLIILLNKLLKRMKKLFTLAMLAMLTIGASAQDGIRRTWDFTKGFSTTTIENLKKAGWTDQTANQCIQSAKRKEGSLTYEIDGVEWTVPETTGLTFHAVDANHLNFAYDLGGYVGRKFIWLNGKKPQDAITINEVPAGENVTIQFESHKNTEARGFKVVSGNFADAEGKKSWTSMGEVTTVTLINSETTTSSLKIQATNGFHIYSIVIGEGDPTKTDKIAYLYSGAEESYVATLKARENTEVTSIDVANTTITADQLKDYSLVVISANIPSDNASVAVVKEALPFTPTLNFNSNLYSAWGYGEAIALEMPLGIVQNEKHTLLNGVEILEEDGIKYIAMSTTPINGIKLGEYFDGDAMPLTDMSGEITVSHLHNIDHNGYIYMPYEDGATAEAGTIMSNAIDLLISSKAAVTSAPTPGIVLEYKNLNTNITLTAPNALSKPHIYYTLDGSEPTIESTEYKETINVTEPCTLKAVLIAEGYLLSSVTAKEIDIKEQPKTPVISADYMDGKTTVTITCESADDNTPIYYNCSGSTKTNQSNKYTGPIVVNKPTDIYAYAIASESVWSEVAHQRVVVKNAHVAADIIGHFTASSWTKTDAEGAVTTLSNNGSLFTSGTKDTYSMYTLTGNKIVDPETGDEIDEKIENDYTISDEPGENPQWMAMTKGQVVLWQNNDGSKTDIIGDNDAGVYPATPLDVDTIFKGTKNNLCFYTVHDGEIPNAVIQSKGKYAGPFDVVLIDNMASGALIIQKSTDGKNWEQVGDTLTKTGYSRLWKLESVSYTGTDEVYVRVAQPSNGASGPKIYDIYIANTGEKSLELKKQYDDEWQAFVDGIETVNYQSNKVMKAIYNLNGIRQNGLQRGLNIVVMEDGSVKKVIK